MQAKLQAQRAALSIGIGIGIGVRMIEQRGVKRPNFSCPVMPCASHYAESRQLSQVKPDAQIYR